MEQNRQKQLDEEEFVTHEEETKQNLHDEFDAWFEEVKQNAIEDFGFTKSETENFNKKNWKSLWEKGLTPFESVIEQLKNKFKFQNG